MPVELKIRSNIADIPVFLTRLNERAVTQAVRRSISRTFTGVRADAAAAVRDNRMVNTRLLPIAMIKSRYFRERDRSAAARMGEMSAELSINDGHPSLRYFFAQRKVVGKTLRNRRPLYGVQVTVMGKTYVAGRAFISPKNGPTGPILMRQGRARTPLRKLFGPSFATMMVSLGAADKIHVNARERYARELATNLKYFLGRESLKK